ADVLSKRRPDVAQCADRRDLVVEVHGVGVGLHVDHRRAEYRSGFEIANLLRLHATQIADERGVRRVEVVETGEHVAPGWLARVAARGAAPRTLWRRPVTYTAL